MRSLTSCIVAAFATLTSPAAPNPWQQILNSVGLTADIQVVREAAALQPDWRTNVESGGLLILEGVNAIGFKMTARKVRVASLVDVHNPKLPIIWESPVEIFAADAPPDAEVFAKERWTGAPLLAGIRMGRGAVLWAAVPPGPRGYERFPYVPQALADLGFVPRWRSKELWAFFDSSYRTRADLDYLAARWRSAGIAAIHVAAWHFNEPDPGQDDYLRRLIEACHKRAILVYAWLELPHVSEKFWNDHPQWREKTGLLQDAHLDWRKLMNLQNRDCFTAVSHQVNNLLNRFDWDGVNLAELYFESLEGAANPARFTPFNDDVRRDFGSDPIEMLRTQNAPGLQKFLAYRANLAHRMQVEWIAEIESVRKNSKTHLDLVLTHVDDRFDPRIRDLIGADAARVLPLLESTDFSFLIEDPATIWNLGPERYEQIAARYAPLTARKDKLSIDINIVERYQDVYPTKQQTGTELFQLVHTAAKFFPRVALYFENSILPPDLGLLSASAAVATAAGPSVTGPKQFGLISEPVTVDGNVWPVYDGKAVWLPSGTHKLEPGTLPSILLTDLNAELKSARSLPAGLEFTYTSASRAIATFSGPVRILIDGQPSPSQDGPVTFLPRGSHTVTAMKK